MLDAAAHRFVGRLADVRRALGNAAKNASEQCRAGFDEQDVAGLVVVTGDTGAFVYVDAADDRQDAERNCDG